MPQGEGFTLQVVKDGHSFVGDGFVRIGGDSLLTLTGALDGVRVWDRTKVRLAGRVAGGLEQGECVIVLMWDCVNQTFKQSSIQTFIDSSEAGP